MGLLGNYDVLNKTAGSFNSGGATGLGLGRDNFKKYGRGFNRYQTIDPTSAHPLGTMTGNALQLAQKSGGIASRSEAIGVATLAASGAMGVNGEVTITGEALLEAVGQLVVSAVATISGSSTVSANILAALAASTNISGSSSLSASIDALAWAVAALQGEATTEFTPSATGALAANIEVAATADLTAGAVADEILDAQMVETGLSVRETLRLCAAALAGKVSISGSTVTIRNAVADSEDRIIATTTTDGERTSVTYDLG
jgi:hypothetical protein